MNITISALTIVISILLTVGMSLLVSLMVSRKNDGSAEMRRIKKE